MCTWNNANSTTITATTPDMRTVTNEARVHDVVVETVYGGTSIGSMKFYFVDEKSVPPTSPITEVVNIPNKRTAHLFCQFKAVIQTIMNQNGLIIASSILPDDRFEPALIVVRRILQGQIDRKEEFVQAVYVDDAARFGPMYVSL